MKRSRKIIGMMIVVLSLWFTGCGANREEQSNATQIVAQVDGGSTDSSNKGSYGNSDGDTKTDKSDHESNNISSDTDIGLKSFKVDLCEDDFDEKYKKLIQYFDDDYLQIFNYEMIRRYTKLFNGAEVENYGRVGKVIKQDSSTFEALYGWSYEVDDYRLSWSDYSDKLVLLKGKTQDAYLMDNDFVYITGNMTGEVETVEYNGNSYTLPVVEVFKYVIWSGNPSEQEQLDEFSAKDVKDIARIIFGDDTSLRESSSEDISKVFSHWPPRKAYTAVPENQKNANFSSFMFYDGFVIVLSGRNTYDDDVTKLIEFAPDFEHYLLFTYDASLETLELGYYDREFNKIWQKEFEETTNAAYDYTKTHLYIVANNTLYIMDMSTGDYSFDPQYVGGKMSVCKVKDGLILVQPDKSDGIMKCDLEGKVLWSKNLPESNTDNFVMTQVMENRIILSYTYDGDPDNYIYCLYDLDNGDLIQSAVSLR